MDFQTFFFSLLYLIPAIGLLVGTIILASKKGSVESVLMVIGMSGELVIMFFNMFVMPALLQSEIITYDFYGGSGFIVIRVFQVLFSLLFATGFLLFVMNSTKKHA